jgi:hypothetical protein
MDNKHTPASSGEQGHSLEQLAILMMIDANRNQGMSWSGALGWAERISKAATQGEDSSTAEQEVSPRVAALILKVRDELAKGDVDEAYHWLYQISAPNFDKLITDEPDGVWKDIEAIASSTHKEADSQIDTIVSLYEECWQAHKGNTRFQAALFGQKVAQLLEDEVLTPPSK